jgi:hypothetical protein
MHQRDRAFYLREIEAILEKPLEAYSARVYRLGRVSWVGRPGYSDSIAAWIRHVWEILKQQENFKSAEHYFIRCYSAAQPESTHNHLYFAFHYGPALEGRLIACGGATDYSGQGRHAKELAESFMEHVCEGSLGVVRILDTEIGWIIERMLEE